MKRSSSSEVASADISSVARLVRGEAETKSSWDQPVTASEAEGQDEDIERAEHDACLMESFFSLSHELLKCRFDSYHAGYACQEYLTRLGFDLRHMDALPLGLFVDHATMRDGLLDAGYDLEHVESAGLLVDQRLTGRIVGPIRGLTGRITGFWARHPENQPPTYLYFSSGWKHEVIAFGLDLAIRACRAHENEIFLVEDILDTLLFQSSGILNVASLMNSMSTVTPKRWQRLASLGIQRVTLVLNNDQNGSDRTLEAIDNAFQAKDHPVVYVLPCEELGEFTSPGGYVRKTTLGDFICLVKEKAVHAYHYKAWSLLKKYRGHHWMEDNRRGALDEAIAFYVSQATASRDDLDRFFVPPIVDELGLSWGSETRPPEPEASQVAAEAVPAVTARNRRVARNTECVIHRCGETDCFCFD